MYYYCAIMEKLFVITSCAVDNLLFQMLLHRVSAPEVAWQGCGALG